jgi:hypothetical protein
VIVDLSGARYVDQTVQERLKELREEFARENLSLVIRGLGAGPSTAASNPGDRKDEVF